MEAEGFSYTKNLMDSRKQGEKQGWCNRTAIPQPTGLGSGLELELTAYVSQALFILYYKSQKALLQTTKASQANTG